jgi:hypothetical protein
MDSVLYHVENISIPMLLMGSLGLLIGLLVLPKKFGFYFSIFLMGAWLSISRFNGLAPISTAAKFTFMVPPLMMLFCASAIPGSRRPIPLAAWAYLLCPLFGLICIAGTTDKLQGVAQFSAMFFMAVGAITLYRVANNNEVLTKSLVALFLGLLVPVAICCLAASHSALVLIDSNRLGCCPTSTCRSWRRPRVLPRAGTSPAPRLG